MRVAERRQRQGVARGCVTCGRRGAGRALGPRRALARAGRHAEEPVPCLGTGFFFCGRTRQHARLEGPPEGVAARGHRGAIRQSRPGQGVSAVWSSGCKERGMRCLTGAARAAVAATAAVVAALLVLVRDDSDRQRTSAQSSVRTSHDCPVTVTKGSTPPGENPRPDRHGNGKLWAALDREGRFVVAPESEYLGPAGEVPVDGILRSDGYIGWWRGDGVRGRVRIRFGGWMRPLPASTARSDPPARSTASRRSRSAYRAWVAGM